MMDPLGKPAFRPSPTKPIPLWMQISPQSPAWQQHTLLPAIRPRSLLDDHFPTPNRGQSATPQDEAFPPLVSCPTSPEQLHLIPSRRASPMVPLGVEEDLAWPEQPSVIMSPKGPSFVKTEPLVRPSSRVMGFGSTDPDDVKPSHAVRQPTVFEEHEPTPQQEGLYDYPRQAHIYTNASDSLPPQSDYPLNNTSPSVHLAGRAGGRSILPYASVSLDRARVGGNQQVTPGQLLPSAFGLPPSPPHPTSRLPLLPTQISAPQSREYLDSYHVEGVSKSFPTRLRGIFSEQTLKREANKRARLKRGIFGDRSRLPAPKPSSEIGRVRNYTPDMHASDNHVIQHGSMQRIPQDSRRGGETTQGPAQGLQGYLSLGNLRSRSPLAMSGVRPGTVARLSQQAQQRDH
ncbi:uncharacterized protein B0I36DRAFT_76895 [Microdochium trichocladiopsis]|uniref:Uncharacterized protein n=1 Tax=Microdochium trichocladiopsis TaxID=1682393 RepID=A0A9P9BV20_9PEZI|nr:uncharacterized protein B0I36DRAFT_76895 [Microdochium trichocladiopsis]KAH7038201.1 hypothetical protein B0I36DRAFT_76895 [Microdochium trichocladiopsis]